MFTATAFILLVMALLVAGTVYRVQKGVSPNADLLASLLDSEELLPECKWENGCVSIMSAHPMMN